MLVISAFLDLDFQQLLKEVPGKTEESWIRLL